MTSRAQRLSGLSTIWQTLLAWPAGTRLWVVICPLHRYSPCWSLLPCGRASISLPFLKCAYIFPSFRFLIIIRNNILKNKSDLRKEVPISLNIQVAPTCGTSLKIIFKIVDYMLYSRIKNIKSSWCWTINCFNNRLLFYIFVCCIIMSNSQNIQK